MCMCKMSVLVYGSLNIMINSGHNIIIKLKGWFMYKWWSFESVTCNPVYSLCFSLAKGVDDIEKRSNNVTKTKFVMGLVGTCIQKEQDEKSSLAKNQPVGANWWWDISNVMLQRLHKKIRLKRPGSLTLRSKPILQGFVWSHQSKPVLIVYLPTSLH